MTNEFENPDVLAVFLAYPDDVREKLLFLRRLIFEAAAETDRAGRLEECLKWGQPSYVTAETGSGSTIRIDRTKAGDGEYAVYVHCATKLIDTFRAKYPKDFRFEGRRAIVFGPDDDVPVAKLKDCLALALTYHLGQKRQDVA